MSDVFSTILLSQFFFLRPFSTISSATLSSFLTLYSLSCSPSLTSHHLRPPSSVVFTLKFHHLPLPPLYPPPFSSSLSSDRKLRTLSPYHYLLSTSSVVPLFSLKIVPSRSSVFWDLKRKNTYLSTCFQQRDWWWRVGEKNRRWWCCSRGCEDETDSGGGWLERIKKKSRRNCYGRKGERKKENDGGAEGVVVAGEERRRWKGRAERELRMLEEKDIWNLIFTLDFLTILQNYHPHGHVYKEWYKKRCLFNIVLLLILPWLLWSLKLINIPEFVSQFRMISLCNVIYKIIFEVIVNMTKFFFLMMLSPLINRVMSRDVAFIII